MMRAGFLFSLIDNETGKRVDGINECIISMKAADYGPTVTLKMVDTVALNINITDLVLKVEEPKTEQVTIVEEFKGFES